MKMKKVFFVLMALCLVSSLAFAEEAATVVATDANTAAVTELSSTATTEIGEPSAATVITQAEQVAPETASVVVPEAVPVVAAETTVVKGDIIDNTCAAANQANLADFVKTHAKECALKPGCIESGYSIFVDGKLFAFDQASSVKVAEFLKKADSKLQVVITAKQVGDELNLVSIENQN
jgi:hypothetical protein